MTKELNRIIQGGLNDELHQGTVWARSMNINKGVAYRWILMKGVRTMPAQPSSSDVWIAEQRHFKVLCNSDQNAVLPVKKKGGWLDIWSIYWPNVVCLSRSKLWHDIIRECSNNFGINCGKYWPCLRILTEILPSLTTNQTSEYSKVWCRICF